VEHPGRRLWPRCRVRRRDHALARCLRSCPTAGPQAKRSTPPPLPISSGEQG